MRATKTLASNEEWQPWGELDPFYGVAASFYEIGAIDWNLFRSK
jgi:hypothetical protein